MEFLNFLREEPVMIWFVLIALLVTVVPVASVLWHRMSARNLVDAAKQPAPVNKAPRPKGQGINTAPQAAGFRQPSSQETGNLTEEIKPTHFGNQTELVILLVGLVLLLVVIGWIRSTFFG